MSEKKPSKPPLPTPNTKSTSGPTHEEHKRSNVQLPRRPPQGPKGK